MISLLILCATAWYVFTENSLALLAILILVLM
jgi:hypothetical protein